MWCSMFFGLFVVYLFICLLSIPLPKRVSNVVQKISTSFSGNAYANGCESKFKLKNIHVIIMMSRKFMETKWVGEYLYVHIHIHLGNCKLSGAIRRQLLLLLCVRRDASNSKASEIRLLKKVVRIEFSHLNIVHSAHRYSMYIIIIVAVPQFLSIVTFRWELLRKCENHHH